MLAFIDKPLDIARIGDQNAASGPIQESKRRGEGEDVVKGQRTHSYFFAFLKGDTDPAAGLLNVSEHIAVREHRAFRNTRRAARILQEGDVFVGQFHGLEAFFVGQFHGLEAFLMADGKRLTEIHRAGQRPLRHHLLDVFDNRVHKRALYKGEKVAHLRGDDMFDRGMRENAFERLGEVFNNDDRLGAGISELMLEFSGGVKRINVYNNETGSQNAKKRHRVLQEVRHHNGHAIAFLHVGQRLQISGEITGERLSLLRGECHPHVGKGRRIRMLLSNAVKERGNIGHAVRINHCGDALRVLGNPRKV